jgi:bifunctional DNA-binding transcriptional regulator/antitoxin component of YhaV-PrlF toxin-antitoxin module
MNATSTLTRRHQTTIPKAVVQALGLKPSDRLVYEIRDSEVLLRARTGLLADAVRDSPLKPPARRAALEDVREAVAASYALRGARSARKGRRG